MLNLTLQFFCSDFRLLSSYTIVSHCSKLFFLKEIGHMHFLKRNLVAKNSCEKEHSNCQSKYFSELSESKDGRKSHAECNIVQFSGSNVESHQCAVMKKVIQEKKACIVKVRSLHRVWFLSQERRNVEPVSFRAFPVL